MHIATRVPPYPFPRARSENSRDEDDHGSPTMRLEPDSPRRTDEQRRYFPDFAPYLLEDCEELEADHNSYLAGGYAEEFGYWAQTGSSRGVPLLDDEPLEQHAKWFGQAGAMHPGYPIKPSPLTLDGPQSGGLYTRWPQLAAA